MRQAITYTPTVVAMHSSQWTEQDVVTISTLRCWLTIGGRRGKALDHPQLMCQVRQSVGHVVLVFISG